MAVQRNVLRAETRYYANELLKQHALLYARISVPIVTAFSEWCQVANTPRDPYAYARTVSRLSLFL